ncbi:MAG TPA: cyclopropane-fatty-acyl-phospholipid synthase family protein [Acidimicrobiales bacterium]|nr:cyclopropane-fatty-acyl-phospholipid synthase family protein [Acidimicrobiales bacterium]
MPDAATPLSIDRSDSLASLVDFSPQKSQRARRILFALARRSRGGRLVVTDEVETTELGRGALVAHVTVHDPRAYTALLQRGSLGLGLGYLEGWWDCDDLVALVRILVRGRGRLGRIQDEAGRLISLVADPLRRRRRRPPTNDRRFVQAHYDIGNEFFSLVLDPTMSYSCAVFENVEDTLESASLAKLDRICRKLSLGANDHVLEIGTGWGGFAVFAASRYGCRVTTTTISAEQYDYATRLVAERGLADRVTVLNQDYRDLRGTYDKLVSIEMIEAVDWRQVPGFFRACSRLLAPDGLMALQAITIDDASYDRAKTTTDFIKAFVFPGGSLPSMTSLTAASTRAHLRVVDVEDIGRHYAETLRRWRENFEHHLDDVRALGYDERFERLWTLYLTYCEAAFLERHVSDVQMVLARDGWRPALATRA